MESETKCESRGAQPLFSMELHLMPDGSISYRTSMPLALAPESVALAELTRGKMIDHLRRLPFGARGSNVLMAPLGLRVERNPKG